MNQWARGSARSLGILAILLLDAAAPARAALGREALTESKPALAKVSSHLLRARKLIAEGLTSAQVAAAVPSARMKEGTVNVQLRLETLDPQVLHRARDRGLEIDRFDFSSALVYGRIDPDRLDELASLPEVSTVHPRPFVGTRAGSATSQADATMRTLDARTTLGHAGTGVTVGILSDSFNNGLGGTESGGVCTCAVPGSTCANVVDGMANQATGDLPGSIPLLDDCTGPGAVLGDPCFGLSDEGAALGELMFDAAPGASFMFHSAFNSPADFAAGITELANCGADLVVDDVFWTGQPLFQDGEIAQAAQAAVDGGVPYFSAAGNDATFGVHDAFSDVNDPEDDISFPPSGDDLHDFDGGDRFAAITLPADCSIFAELQWSEPFDGTLGPGASSDLDLYLLSSAAVPGGNVLALSTTATGCGSSPTTAGCADGICGDPVESVFYENTTGASDTVFLAVEHYCGDEGVDMRIVTLSFDCSTLAAGWNFEDGGAGESSIFVDPQIFGHPAAAGVVAVGAAFYGEIDTSGAVEPPFGGQLDVEPFSSLGGDLPFYFDPTGTPLGPVTGPLGPLAGTHGGPTPGETRSKPEVTGPDGTNTTFFGSDIDFDPDMDPNFFGTSASAPNAAAIAALILEATDLKLNPLPLQQLLSQGSLDMEFPGFDDLSGSGFIDALGPLRSLDSSTTPLIDDLDFFLDGGTMFSSPPTGMQRVQANNSIIFGDGDFTGVEGVADTLIFADGFESGNTSAWSN